MNEKNYSGNFSDWQDVTQYFEINRETPEPDYIWASYDRGSYDGAATVVFYDSVEKNWNLVEGSHCSCYGLEGQFNPEVFDPDAHLKALTEDKRYVNSYEWSESDKKDFDDWFKWVVKQA